MPLNKGKHLVEEIDGARCSVVEKAVSPERTDFLKKLLGETGTFKIGVTDLLFNPVIDVYKRRLKSFSGKKVTPAYWLQQSDQETEKEVNYWK